MAGNVRPGHFLALCWLTGHHHNFGNLGSDKQRHGVGHGPGSTPATVPADHYPIKLQTDSLNIRHNERGPTRVEQRRLDDEPLKCRLVGLRLTHDRQIEPSRNVGEKFVGARDRYVDYARFGRNGGASRDFIELGYRGLYRLLVLNSLRLHRLGGKTIGHGCERLVQEGEPRKVRTERSGYRNGKIRRDVA